MKTLHDYVCAIIVAYLPSNDTGRKMVTLAHRMLFEGRY